MTIKSSTFRLLAVFGLLAIPTIASTHAGNNDPNVIHACVGNASKIVRIVGAGGSCTTAETPMHWDVQGQAGTNGIDGINGTNGSSVTFSGYFGGDQNGCPNGGAVYATSTGNTFVCNGLNASATPRAAGPCFNNTARYVDCGNGTVTDTVTGLIWLQQWNCLGAALWAAGNQAAATMQSGDCGLTDNSAAGDWRLPTAREWAETIARAGVMGCLVPVWTNDAGTGCYQNGAQSSFAGLQTGGFWSGTSHEALPVTAWFTTMSFGDSTIANKGALSFLVWPVRGGAR